MSPTSSFETDSEYLEVAFDHLQVRVQRIGAERDLRGLNRREPDGPQPGIDDDLVRRVTIYREREKQQHDLLQARLEAHRNDHTAPKLKIDRLAEQHDLTEEMRTVLLSCLCSALSEERGEEVHGDLGTGMYGSQSVEGLMRLLDGRSVADRVRLRRLFDAESPLLKQGLIVIDFYRTEPRAPEDVLGSRVRISEGGFNAVVGNGPGFALVGDEP